jgi:hypothetical protein
VFSSTFLRTQYATRNSSLNTLGSQASLPIYSAKPFQTAQ